MHEHAESSRVGASFLAKQATDNPREMLIHLIEKNKDATKDDLFKIFRKHLDDEPGYQRAVDWYFFINMYEYAMTNRNRNKDPVERAEARERQSKMVESIKAQIIMLDLTMPNGKAMRECTGGEMAKFGNRFQKIAERVGKTKLVGEVLAEDQVKAIMK